MWDRNNIRPYHETEICPNICDMCLSLTLCVCVFVCACVYKLEKVQCDPVRNGTGGLWYREMWIAGTAGFLQGHRVWPRPRWSRLMVLCKHLHTGCQDLSQRLIKTFHWNPCEVAKPPPLHKQPAAYFCTPQTQTVCVHTQGITHTLKITLQMRSGQRDAPFLETQCRLPECKESLLG